MFPKNSEINNYLSFGLEICSVCRVLFPEMGGHRGGFITNSETSLECSMVLFPGGEVIMEGFLLIQRPV